MSQKETEAKSTEKNNPKPISKEHPDPEDADDKAEDKNTAKSESEYINEHNSVEKEENVIQSQRNGKQLQG